VVVVRVEVGRVSLCLDRALGLIGGAVLDLGRDVGPAVKLYAGDRFVARGELVDRDGRLAVLVTEVS
jgi:flagellar motor switch protein FliN/FliY